MPNAPSSSPSPTPSRLFRRLAPLALLLPLIAFAPIASAGPGEAGIKPAGSSSAKPAPTGKLGTGLEALEKSDYATAEADLKAVTGKDVARATVGLARLAYETGKYADAESLAKKGATQAGTDAETKFDAIGWQGMAMLATGRIEDAIKLTEPLDDEQKAPRARMVLVDAYLRKGERDDARKSADKLQADSEGDSDEVYKNASALACVGRVSHLVRDIKYANGTFKEAQRTQKKHVETNLYWARLFLDYYDPGHAEESVRDVLAVAPNNAMAHVLSAEIKLEQSFDWDAAEKEIDAALKINPKLPRAYYVRASLKLHDLEIANAEAEIAKGLAIDPNDLELLSLKAAARFLDDDLAGYGKAKDEVLKKRNAGFGNFFVIVGEFAEWEHRYDDLVTMMQEATKIDPRNGKAWAELGFNLLRRGDEKEGRAALDSGYKVDKFNVRLVNMLNLYEKTLDKEFALYDGTGTASTLRFRFQKDEAPLLGKYLPKTLGTAWGVMVKKYGFTPKNPVQIEVYPEREHFSVRTAGLPSIGPAGVCFGRVITAVSPKKESSNWGLVLWHELGHVFAIQLSKNHVPRWFTEGLSEYETIVTRPEWHRDLDPQLWLGLKSNKLPKVADMNRAFTHAKSQSDVVVAYYASSQMIVYIAEKYGFPKIVEMLKLWGEGKKSVDVVKGALGVSADQLDTDFRAWVKKKLSRYEGQFMFDPSSVPEVDDAKKAADAAPKDGGKRAQYAAALFLDRKFKEADVVAKEAIGLDPKEQLAHYILAKLAFGLRKDVNETKAHADAIVAAGGDGFTVENMLADLAEAQKDSKAAKVALEKAIKFDPTQFGPYVDLYEIAVNDKRDDDALELLRKMVKLDPHERLPWKKLMSELIKRSLWDEAVLLGEGAIFVDVYSPEVHGNYARALAMKGRYKDAHDEIDGGLAAAPKPEGEAFLRVESARIYQLEKNPAKAKGELETALKLDPKNAEAAKLKAQIK
jgi:tetratricopeptide (TPR) repeat protein